jgi:hypothetical protein
MDAHASVPTPNRWDKAHALAKGGLGCIPIVGGFAAEFFTLVLQPPLQKKLERWMAGIAEKIYQLGETVSTFDPLTLSDNENFAAAVLAVTQAAMKTSDEVKTSALRNAILNTALTPDQDVYRRETLNYLIDRLTSAHLNLLAIFVAYESKRMDLESALASLPMPTADDFPPISSDIRFANCLAFDLIQSNLLSVSGDLRNNPANWPFYINQTGHLGTHHMRMTSLGEEFLSHISDPAIEAGRGMERRTANGPSPPLR